MAINAGSAEFANFNNIFKHQIYFKKRQIQST